jgi:hypothetical protein
MKKREAKSEESVKSSLVNVERSWSEIELGENTGLAINLRQAA